jgi:hypothetical protein
MCPVRRARLVALLVKQIPLLSPLTEAWLGELGAWLRRKTPLNIDEKIRYNVECVTTQSFGTCVHIVGTDPVGLTGRLRRKFSSL